MRRRLITVFLFIVAAPLGLVTWLGLRSLGDEKTRENQQYRTVIEGRLYDVNERIGEVFQSKKVELLQLDNAGLMAKDEIRGFLRKSRLIKQIFVLSADGTLSHPPPLESASLKEAAFFIRTNSIGITKELFLRSSEAAAQTRRSAGWHTWFWGEGINFIFWRHDSDGTIVGFELERSAMISDIVAAMPDTEMDGPIGPTGRIALSDASGNTIYQWGDYRPKDGESPAATILVAPPLSSWRLHYYIDMDHAASFVSEGYFALIGAIIAIILAIIGLAIYFYRESSREMREALKRMSFVNQVSHELKTPLTNIRMYAELLQKDFEPDSTKANRYLNILVTESNRLSRLIGNVLTFAKHQKSGIQINARPGVVDDIIADTIENFRPVLKTAGVTVEFTPGAQGRVSLDPDALDQILNNLISNVEKYASKGGWLGITSSQRGDCTTISISDRGPGIPPTQRQSIFRPFVRLSNKLTDGVAGTGIGLTIAKNLALLHGGTLGLMPGDDGATFVVEIYTPGEMKDDENSGS
ncbi:MAG: hypothetical protein CMN78_00275 [Spirochaetales bacterium]|nr:hypothetical protein [Spirochaetales bacterium]